MNEFGARLRSARKMAGLSMEALADLANNIVTKQSISKYEKGMATPSSEILIALARALNVKIDYFFRDTKVFIDSFEFRKHSKLGKKAEEQIKYKTMDFIEKYLEIENVLNVKSGFKNPLSQRTVINFSEVEAVVQDIRKKWQLGNEPISHIIELLEEKGVKVLEISGTKHFDGFSCFVSTLKIPVIAVAKEIGIVRKRFTIAHELGHLLLDLSCAQDNSVEKLCHSFAGALLLPEEVIKKELGAHRKKITLFELETLKSHFGISMQAILARAKALRIISENYYRHVCIYGNKHGWRKKEPGDYKGVESAKRFKQLIYHALAEQIISFSKGAELLNISINKLNREVEFV